MKSMRTLLVKLGLLLTLALTSDAYAAKLPENFLSLIRELKIETFEDALRLVQLKETKSYLEPKEIAEAIVSLSRLQYPSLHFLPFREEGYEEAFIQALKIDATQIQLGGEAQPLPRVSEERHELAERIQRTSVDCNQCFPIESLPENLQPKALAVLKHFYTDVGLYTLIGGLKPMSWPSLPLKSLKIQADEFELISKVLHCGGIVYENGTLSRLDRVEDAKIQYRDWLEQAGISQGAELEKILKSTASLPKIDISRNSVSPIWTIHIIQTALDVTMNDPSWEQGGFERSLAVLKRHFPDFTDKTDKDTLVSKIFSLGDEEAEPILLDVVRNDNDSTQRFITKVQPILQETLSDMKDPHLTPILEKIRIHNQIANKKNKEIEQKREEDNKVPLLEALKRDPEHTQKLLQKVIPMLQTRFPEVTSQTDLAVILEKIEIYNQGVSQRNKEIDSYRDKIVGALLGFPRYSIEFFASNPEKRQALDYPTLTGKGQFVYVIPVGQAPNPEDIKIGRAAFTIFSHFIRKDFGPSSPRNAAQTSIQDELNHIRSFYRLESQPSRCSPARLDDLRFKL